MKKTKKALALLLAALMLSLCACADKGAPDAPQEDAEKAACTISISCEELAEEGRELSAEVAQALPEGGIFLPETEVELEEGESAFDVLSRVCREQEIPMEFSSSSEFGAYVEGIGSIYAGACGEMSGWMYEVNGEMPNVGCSSYILEDGDAMEWTYYCADEMAEPAA